MLWEYDTMDLPNSAGLDPANPEVQVNIATTEEAGIVKPDGTSITVEEDGTIHAVGSAEILYTNENPSIAVGGIAEGSTFEDQTVQEMFDSLLYPELFPALTAPSLTVTKAPTTTYYEIGASIGLAVTATFNRGSITPAYGTDGYRSGLPNKYTWTGAQIAGEYNSTELTNSQSITAYTVLSGANTWTCTCSYDAGEQPKSNKGNDYDSALPAGSTSAIATTIQGVYPYYATTSAIDTMTKQPLKAMNASYTEIALVAETDSDKQKVAFPEGWSAITGVQFLNTLNNTWEWIGGTKASSLTNFTTSATTYEVQGNTVNYTLYTFNGSKTGARSLRFYTT